MYSVDEHPTVVTQSLPTQAKLHNPPLPLPYKLSSKIQSTTASTQSTTSFHPSHRPRTNQHNQPTLHNPPPKPQMPPKRVQIQPASSPRRAEPSGYMGLIYREVTAPENQSVVRSVAMFGVSRDCLVVLVLWRLMEKGVDETWVSKLIRGFRLV